MYWIGVSVFVCLSTVTLQNLRKPHLPWRTNIDEGTETQKVLCELPPYPEGGGYVVTGDPDAKPGDLKENVSFVQYKPMTEKRMEYFEITYLHCSRGDWSQSLIDYENEISYFNSSWCPLFCPEGVNDTNASSPKTHIIGTSKTLGENKKNGSCILPPYPERGGYFVSNMPDAKPGDESSEVSYYEYMLLEDNTIYRIKERTCKSGQWFTTITKENRSFLRFFKVWCPIVCAPFSVKDIEVIAQEQKSQSIPSDAPKDLVEASTEVLFKNRPKCVLPPYPKDGNYTVANRPEAKSGDAFDSVRLDFSCEPDTKLFGNQTIYCVEGVWSHDVPKCIRCGYVRYFPREDATEEVMLRKELPWHVAVYNKEYSPYRQICGGSIIATNMIVSAAHCFWGLDDAVQPASRFAVAAGKLYRAWSNPYDAGAQKSNVAEIKIAPKFRGSQTNYRDDVALLYLSSPFVYNEYIAPVCLDFDVDFDVEQLQEGNYGKIAGWTLADQVEDQNSKLQLGWLPYVEINKCISEASPDFREYITSDKICAGNAKGTGLCERDGGSGLAFQTQTDNGFYVVFYLRAIASVAPTDVTLCAVGPTNTFTHLLRYENFLKNNFANATW